MFGDVGSAVISNSGQVFFGVSSDVGSTAICAEQAALGSMITAGQYKIKKIVAVWKDKKGSIYVIPPCGNCRQYIKDLDAKNLETEVVLDINKEVKLKDLLPFHDLWTKVT